MVWVKLAVPAVKEQGEGEVLKSKEEADLLLRDVRRVMEFLFFSLRLHFSIYGGTKELGGVDSSLLFSLRVLFWLILEKKGVLAGLLYIPPFFT